MTDESYQRQACQPRTKSRRLIKADSSRTAAALVSRMPRWRIPIIEDLILGPCWLSAVLGVVALMADPVLFGGAQPSFASVKPLWVFVTIGLLCPSAASAIWARANGRLREKESALRMWRSDLQSSSEITSEMTRTGITSRTQEDAYSHCSIPRGSFCQLCRAPEFETHLIEAGRKR